MSASRLGKQPWNKGLTYECPERRGQKRPAQTIESNRKRSEKLKGSLNPFYGKNHSPESLKLISDSLKGKEAWNKKLQSVAMYTSNLCLIEVYNTIDDLLKKNTHLNRHGVLRAIRKNFLHKEHYFKFQ